MVLDRIALILVIIGALNWGLIGLFGLDLVAFLFPCGAGGPVVRLPAVPGEAAGRSNRLSRTQYALNPARLSGTRVGF